MAVQVHPSATAVDGFPTVPSLGSLKNEVDLAMIAAPPNSTPSLLEDCWIAGVKAAVIITGGLAEVRRASLYCRLGHAANV